MIIKTQRYIVLEREDIWLAVLDNSQYDMNFLDVYSEQGFRPYDYAFRHFYSPIAAQSAQEAIRVAQEDKKHEINALREEVYHLRKEVEAQRTRRRQGFTPDMLNPYDVLGVSEKTELSVIKQKRRHYLKLFHTDHGEGSKLLFQIINYAFQRIEEKHKD